MDSEVSPDGEMVEKFNGKESIRIRFTPWVCALFVCKGRKMKTFSLKKVSKVRFLCKNLDG